MRASPQMVGWAGTDALRAALRWPTDDQKVFRTGTDRSVPPAATLRRVAPLLGPAGITRVGRISGLDRLGIDVFAAYRPAARSVSVSQGKGATAEAARASAIMEALELWHAETHHLPLLEGSVRRMRRSHRLVDIYHLLRWSPAPPRMSDVFRWVEGLELLSDEAVLIPYEAVHADARTPFHPSEGVFWRGSNGLASGNTPLEALIHGICEVVERDATTRSRPFGPGRRRIDPWTVTDAHGRDLLRRCDAAGVELVVWQVHSHTGVPVFEVLIVERRFPWYHPLPQAWGAGAHVNPLVALSRALTEAVQVRSTLISACRDDLLRGDYEEYYDPGERAELLCELGDDAQLADFDATAGARHASFLEDLQWLLQRLLAGGSRQVVAVNLTREDVGLPVVKVVVPGMRW